MKHEFEGEVEDVGATVAAGRSVRESGPYGILIGDAELNFRPAVIQDPIPTGSQILSAAGVREPVEHTVFQMLVDGQLEELRPTETTDLRSRGVEKFLVFRSDRSFRFQLNDQSAEWGASRISGATLKRLAGVDLVTHDVWQDVIGGADILVEDRGFSDLAAPGVERFRTTPVSLTIIVNARRREVHQRTLTYWEVVKLAYPDAAPSETTVYTVTYDRGPRANPEGSMVAGDRVELKSEMTFYVSVTDKS